MPRAHLAEQILRPIGTPPIPLLVEYLRESRLRFRLNRQVSDAPANLRVTGDEVDQASRPHIALAHFIRFDMPHALPEHEQPLTALRHEMDRIQNERVYSI